MSAARHSIHSRTKQRSVRVAFARIAFGICSLPGRLSVHAGAIAAKTIASRCDNHGWKRFGDALSRPYLSHFFLPSPVFTTS